ncbi:MAG: aminomethyl-transferring glycine dehydrogenase, partial [Burkholderiaceae bacterium]
MRLNEPIDSLEGLLAEDEFHQRHLGPDAAEQQVMLAALGLSSLEALIDQTVPESIRLRRPLNLPAPTTEQQALKGLKALAEKNQVYRSYIGAGYYGCITPEPIKRSLLENPGWYTAYTPYQAEVAQGRLEALMNFQQLVIDLTGLPMANASLLDEATAAAEAMGMFLRLRKDASANVYLGVQVKLVDLLSKDAQSGCDLQQVFGAHVQIPNTQGRLADCTVLAERLHAQAARLSVGCDLLGLMLTKPPGDMGADVALGNAQRFGVPMGFGGPHAAFFAVKADLVRAAPGRIIGVSVDAAGKPAYRMSLQTREQHIRRDKATSNICTAQALLANMASFYAVYHGPEGLRRIAMRVNAFTRMLAQELSKAGLTPTFENYFDTLHIPINSPEKAQAILSRAKAQQINLRSFTNNSQTVTGLGVSFDETVGLHDLADLIDVFTGQRPEMSSLQGQTLSKLPASIPTSLLRTGPVLSHPVFHRYRSETEFVRYMKRLENRDISLVHSMIPLGSCTMKLNASSEMAPVSWPEFASLHPFVPEDQSRGYKAMLTELRDWLVEITGFAEVSFQPNSGAQGEYAGIMAIRRYQQAQGQGHRNVCLIPSSAHGTNPATAQMMGLSIVVVGCDAQGNIDLADLQAKISQHSESLCALMVTYPSTHGVFEASIEAICAQVHAAGGQVYMDGANLNAQAGLTQPALIGADVCHMNLHKTFCIPHGGGGPGMGPIAVAKHLAPYLNDHPYDMSDKANSVSAA